LQVAVAHRLLGNRLLQVGSFLDDLRKDVLLLLVPLPSLVQFLGHPCHEVLPVLEAEQFEYFALIDIDAGGLAMVMHEFFEVGGELEEEFVGFGVELVDFLFRGHTLLMIKLYRLRIKEKCQFGETWIIHGICV